MNGRKIIRNLMVFVREGDPDSKRLIARVEQMKDSDLFYIDEFNVRVLWMDQYGPIKLKKLSDEYGVVFTPSVVLKDEGGAVLWRYNNLPTYVELRHNIEA